MRREEEYNVNVGSHLEHIVPIHTHTIVRLYPFAAEIDGSCSPMRVVVVDGNEDDIL
jgi:hypothetical protein